MAMIQMLRLAPRGAWHGRLLLQDAAAAAAAADDDDDGYD